MDEKKKGSCIQTVSAAYHITSAILEFVEKIGEYLGVVKATAPDVPKPHLHRINQIRTIQGTLEIEGNTLTTDQVTAVLDGKRVLAHPRELQEVVMPLPYTTPWSNGHSIPATIC